MTRALGSWFQIEGTMEAGSPLDRAFLTSVVLASLILLFKRGFDWSSAYRNNTWLIVLLGFITISLLWSSMPDISFRRWVREIIVIATSFLIMTEKNPKNALISLLRRTIYVLLPFSLLLIKYYPILGRKYNVWTGGVEWTGVADTKNHLAKLCVIAIFFLLWTLRQRWKGYDLPVVRHQVIIELFLIFLSFFLLGGPHKSLTYSATSTIILVAGISAFIALSWAIKRGISISFMFIGLLVGLIFIYGTVTPFIGGLSLVDVSNLMERDATVTSRGTHIWPILVPFVMRSPIIGYGVGGFWTTEIAARTTASAHNGYLEALLHYGFLGLGLIFLFILSCTKKAIMTIEDENDWGIFFLCLIFMFLLHNITESSIQSLGPGLTAIIVFFSVTTSKRGS